MHYRYGRPLWCALLGERVTKLGHDVRIMACKFVIPYRQNEKNDANDTEAICVAVTRQKTRFISIKSEEQQAVLCLHRIGQVQLKIGLHG